MIYASVIPDGHVLLAVDDSWWWRFHSFHWQHSPHLHYINCYKFLLVANSNIPFTNTGPLLLSLPTLYIWNGSWKFCVGVWIEVSIPTRAWMGGLHHRSGELFLSIEPNATSVFYWNSMILLVQVQMVAYSIALILFFQNSFTTNCFPVFICAVDYSCLMSLTPTKWPTLIKITKTHMATVHQITSCMHFSLVLHSWLCIHCMGRHCLYPDTQIIGNVQCVLPHTESKFANTKLSQLYPWKHHLDIWVCSFSSSPLIGLFRIWLFCRASLPSWKDK